MNTQDMGGVQLKNMQDPTDLQDGMTLNSAASLPRYYNTGVRKTNVWMYDTSAVVSDGVATFYLTDDGTANGNAIFTNIYQESINLMVNDPINQYQYGNFAVAEDKKSISLTVNKISLSLGILAFTSAANGVSVYLQVKGD